MKKSLIIPIFFILIFSYCKKKDSTNNNSVKRNIQIKGRVNNVSPYVQWTRFIGEGKARTIGRINKNLIIFNKSTYYGRESITIVSIHSETGQQSYLKKDYVHHNSKILVKDNTLLYTNSNGFHVLDLVSGKEKFTLDKSQYEIINTVVEDEIFILKGPEHKIDAFDQCYIYSISQNKILWSFRFSNEKLFKSQNYVFLFKKNRIEIVNKKRQKKQKALILKENTKEKNSILLAKNTLLYISNNKNIICYDLLKQQILWKNSDFNVKIEKAFENNNQLYLLGKNNIYCLSLLKGKKSWQRSFLGKLPQVILKENSLLIKTDKELKKINSKTAQIEWSYNIEKLPLFYHQGDFYSLKDMDYGHYSLTRFNINHPQTYKVKINPSNYFSQYKPNLKRFSSLLFMASERTLFPGDDKSGNLDIIGIHLNEKRIWQQSISNSNKLSRPVQSFKNILIASDTGKITSIYPINGDISWTLDIDKAKSAPYLSILHKNSPQLILYYSGYIISLDISKLIKNIEGGSA